MAYSSIGAEILAAASSTDRSVLRAEGLRKILNPCIALPLTIALDSLGLHETISTLHEGKDYRLRPTVSRLRDSFEAGEISELIWIPGSRNIADALTKRNIVIQKLLDKFLNNGEIDDTIFMGAKYGSI